MINVQDYGAGQGGDDTVAIQNSVNALPPKGGEIYLPGATYNLSAPISFGDGDGASNVATRSSIEFVGDGGDFGFNTLPSTVINYTGPQLSAPLFQFNGRMSDCSIRKMMLNLNSNINGIKWTAVSGSEMEEVQIFSPYEQGFQIMGGSYPTGNYNTFNKISRVHVKLTAPKSIGLYMDGNYSTSNDSWLTIFELFRTDIAQGATSAVGAWLKFADSCSFHRCHFVHDNEPTGIGLILDALGNDGFPCGNAFYDCSIKDIVVYEDATHHIRPNFFMNHGTMDNETIPSHPKLIGVTDQGLSFGPIGYGAGSGGSVSQASNKSTSVTLNKYTGVVVTNNAVLPAYSQVSFIVYNSFVSTNDIPVPAITGGASYGSYSVTVSDVQNGCFVLSLRNLTSSSLSEAVQIGFTILKGSAA